ncbi:MAG: enoyl-CoA hydratase/isomerase family protein [Candidatus Lindowbacteria bacterium]|nr:enoyl-CoA hydratase/isomerase family protein [Candidatus Lindowbacteria bacterium]
METIPTFETLLWNQDGPILTITLNRPEILNAFNAGMLRDIEIAVGKMPAMHDVRVVVFTGAGRAFCSGADLTTVSEFHSEVEGDAIAQGIRQAQGVFDSIETLEKPTIAAMNGHAVGAGLQLALACDIRLAVSGAKLGLSDVKIGIVPALGATTRLPKLIGLAKTKELILTGDLISAEEALEIGLVSRVVDAESFGATVKELAEKLGSRAPLAVAAVKRLLNSGASLNDVASAQSHLIKSADALEGVSAFLERRAPTFTGT